MGFTLFDELIITGVRKLKVRYIKNPPRDRWYADPFLLDVTEDKFIVLVEEFRYDNPVGRIARLEVDRRTMRITDQKIVLELDTHLSFPIFFREGKDIFLYPENSASGSLNLYKWIPEQEIFVLQKRLVDAPLTDAVLFSYNGHSFLLSTEATEDAGSGNTMNIAALVKVDTEG
ncbi:MAG: hypothetical protein J6Y32_03595 [Bacteroidales bacterium]|nr:hypothetical protein [Bacteroidales bacterium]